MNKEAIEDIIFNLRQFEWKHHSVDNGADEWRCPAYCCLKENRGKMPELIHDRDCVFDKALDSLEEQLKKIL